MGRIREKKTYVQSAIGPSNCQAQPAHQTLNNLPQYSLGTENRMPSAATAFNTVGIIGKRDDVSVGKTVARLVAHLSKLKRDIIVDHQSAAQLPDWSGQSCSREEMGKHTDLIVVVGGDGTLLDAGRVAGPFDTPLLGVNLGRLGFMVDVLPADMTSTLDEVFAGNYISEQRLLLTAHIERAQSQESAQGTGLESGQSSSSEPSYALNEVVVRNRDFARVLEFDTYMDGEFISHHRADGIIVATPTGSTAYALSGGGPVLHPALPALALVPICPHTLSDRPLVIDAKHRVEIVVDDAQDTQALFTSDGQTNESLAAGDRVVIERADRSLTLIHPRGYDYYNILRNKLHWGRGQKSYTDKP